MRVLVVEDEPRIASLLERGLGEEGHGVSVVGDVRAARMAWPDGDFDLAIVDRGLPDGDGLEFVRWLRADDQHVPVIVLTARDRVEDRVEGLYGGADDYLTKPFSFEELLARIAAIGRRTRPTSSRCEVGDLVVDTEALRVFRGGEEIALTATEFKLLRVFVEHAGKVLSRTRLLELVWDTQHDPGTNIVDVYLSYLRAKIDKGRQRPLLHTVRGLGYVIEDRAS